MYRATVAAISILLLTGCVAQQTKMSDDHSQQFQTIKFAPDVGKELVVETGDEMFVEGDYIPGQSLNIASRVDKIIPGSMMIPFPMSIDAGLIHMNRITRNWKYFCADPSLSAASFPGLGSVVRQGDCVGVRQSIDGSKMQWVVDNSVYNRGLNTVYTLNLSPDEREEFVPSASNIPFSVKTLTTVRFDGYYGGQLHFSYESINGTQIKEQQFIFDYDATSEVLVGIKGKRFTVIHADNITLSYRWEKLN